MNADDILRTLLALINGSYATSYFVNGTPGSGKTHLIKDLAVQLPHHIKNCVVLGPYSLEMKDISKLGHFLIADCVKLGFLEATASNDPPAEGFAGICRWLGEQMQIRSSQSVIVLVDLSETCDAASLPAVSTLFSAIRSLEGLWNPQHFRIYYVLTGYWEAAALLSHFKKTNTSFPYTEGHNYASWLGTDEASMYELFKANIADLRIPLYGKVLFEITGGHPAAALDILAQLQHQQVELESILVATKNAVMMGNAAKALIEVWQQFSQETHTLIRRLVFSGHVQVSTRMNALHEPLIIAGLARVQEIGEKRFLSFRSWYVELVVRAHLAQLGLADPALEHIKIDQLVPTITSINDEAYQVIHDIENNVRNFVASSLMRLQENEMFLQGRNQRYNHQNQLEDAQTRAMRWQRKAQEHGLSVSVNPLLAYCTTRDLADLLREIGVELEPAKHGAPWTSISDVLDDLAQIRDAVMHNQLINFAALQRIYALQQDVYAALGGES